MRPTGRPKRWNTGVFAVGSFVVIKAAMLVAVITTTSATYTSGPPGRQLHGWWAKIFRFDAPWYATIVQRGYQWPGVGLDQRPGLSNLAFFPLFPALGAIVHWVTGLAVPMSLWLVALLASVVAAAGIFRCVSLWGGESIAWLSVVLWGLAPHSLVVVMPYTEGLFTALAAWALVAMTRQRWWWAAGLVALACLTRPTGWVLIVVLVWAVYRASGQSGWRWLTVVFAGAVGVSFPFYVAWRVGQWDGYLQVQRQWHSHGQWPWLGIAEAWGQLSGGGVGPDARWIGAWVLLVVLVVGGWLADRSLRGNTGADLLWLYTAGVVGLALMAGGYPWSRGRFLLPAFGIYAVLAAWLCRLPWAVRAVVLVALSLGSLAWTVVVANGSVSP